MDHDSLEHGETSLNIDTSFCSLSSQVLSQKRLQSQGSKHMNYLLIRNVVWDWLTLAYPTFCWVPEGRLSPARLFFILGPREQVLWLNSHFHFAIIINENKQFEGSACDAKMPL